MNRSGMNPTKQFAYQKGLGTCDALRAGPIHCEVHWREGTMLRLCRLISVLPLIGSTIRAYSIGSAVWILDVMCCLY